jgi:hypothetical protein
MSNDIQREYEELSGRALPSSSGKTSNFRTTLILLLLVGFLFGVQQAVSYGLITVQPGQIVVCSEIASLIGAEPLSSTQNIRAIRESGFHWCWGDAAAFSRTGRLDLPVSFKFGNGTPGEVRIRLSYSIPEVREGMLWDPAIKIFMTSKSQAEFESILLTPAILLATVESFANVKHPVLMTQPIIRQVILKTISLKVRGAVLRKQIKIEVDQLWMDGATMVPRPGLGTQKGREIAI